MPRVDVLREAPDRLTREHWTFTTSAGVGTERIALQLEYYAPEQRATPRHKYQRRAFNDRWDSADDRPYYSRIPRAAVPLPADVVAEAVERVRALVYFQEDAHAN